MDFKLDNHEADLLARVLTNALGDLRMEIRDTESHDFREGLKRDEATIKALLDRLNHLAPVG